MKKLNTEKKVEKYIEHLFGLVLKVVSKHHFWGGFSAWALTEESSIELLKAILKDPKELRILIWHEVGHFFTSKDKHPEHLSIRNEVNAQLWAIKKAKNRGYTKLYKLFCEDVKSHKGWKRPNYRRARCILLDKLKRRDFSLIK